MKSIKTKKRLGLKSVLFLSLGAILPALSDGVIAKKTEKERVQANGYLGQLSQRAIEAGMLDRLTANAVLDGLDLDSGDETADLKTRVNYWHRVALDTVALDHTSVDDDGAPVNQGGPTRTSRAMAMVQIAVFEAINHIEGGYESCLLYTSPSPRDLSTSRMPSSA